MSIIRYEGFNYLKKLKELREVALKSGLTSFNERHLDNAHHAITLKELDFVIENTSSISVKNYALLKREYYYFIKGLKE